MGGEAEWEVRVRGEAEAVHNIEGCTGIWA